MGLAANKVLIRHTLSQRFGEKPLVDIALDTQLHHTEVVETVAAMAKVGEVEILLARDFDPSKTHLKEIYRIVRIPWERQHPLLSRLAPWLKRKCGFLFPSQAAW